MIFELGIIKNNVDMKANVKIMSDLTRLCKLIGYACLHEKNRFIIIKLLLETGKVIVDETVMLKYVEFMKQYYAYTNSMLNASGAIC